MKKRNVIRLASFLTAALLVLGGVLIQSEQKNKRYELEIQNGYSRNLDDFNTAMNNISTTLNKARFVTTPKQISSIAAKLLTEAEISKAALSQLPSSQELTSLNKFLSQVGNYAMSLSKNLISGGEISQADSENIVKLSDTANKISELVTDAHITYNNVEYWAKELDNQLTDLVDDNSLAVYMNDMEDEFEDYPTLIYDGPYSDHILEKEPEMIKQAEAVSENQALRVAAETAQCDTADLKPDGISLGKIPAFRFIGDGVTVAVSKNGGFPVYLRREKNVVDSILSYEQAIEKASRFLERIDMSGFAETYYFENNGVCVINFAYLDGQTICYTDLVKVGVAMDTGEIMLYEASGYLTNHKDRAFQTPVYTVEQAEEILSENVTVNYSSLALIPSKTGEDVRCYEFACTAENGQEILIYINTATLDEEEVLILLKSDGGILVK